MRCIGRSLCFVITLGALSMANTSATAQERATDDAVLNRIRAAARMIPGANPHSIRVSRFAGGDVPISELLEGDNDKPVSGAYTVFQVNYPDGWLMIDAGVGADIAPGVPFREERYAQVKLALEGAKLIVVTHEHHDHVDGVIRSASLAVLRPKTVLTRPQVETLISSPNSPAVRLDPESASQYVVVDYDELLPIASGMVLIKAPGHSPGSQMIFVALQSGAEVLFIGDIAWHMDGVKELRQKPEQASLALREDRPAIQKQLEWIRQVMTNQGVEVINCHDSVWLETLIGRGILSEGLSLP